MENQRVNIPDNADKLLFAEDLVSYAMTDLFDSPYEGTRATPYREFIYNAFNENVKAAVKGLATKLHSICSKFLSMGEGISHPTDSEFLECLPVFPSSQGFDARSFVFYCVYVASMASIFRNKGLEEAPDIAVSRIFEYLRDFDMLSGGWDSLNLAPLRFANSCQHSSSPGSRDVENLVFEHRFPRNSSPEAMDLDETFYPTATEEKKEKIPVGDSANAFTVHEVIGAENVHSPCSSSSNRHLQPSNVLQTEMKNAIQSEGERQDGTGIHYVHLKGKLNNNEMTEAENLQLPSMCESLEDLKISQV